MMQKRSKLFVANIVLGIVFGVLLCISIVVMMIFHVAFEEVERQYEAYGWEDYYDSIQNDSGSWSYDDGDQDYDIWDYDEWSYDDGQDYSDTWDYATVYYTIPSITGASAELIGSTYQEQEAEAGYQFYRLSLQVHNAGTDYMVVNYMDLDVSGEEDTDVYRYYEPYTDYINDFEYSNLELIPSCQTATVSVVIGVKDTVEDVTIEIQPDYDNMETASYVLNLK